MTVPNVELVDGYIVNKDKTFIRKGFSLKQ